MKNIAIILALLFCGFGLALICGAETALAGRIGLAAVFAFTALGHFVKRDAMAAMLPPSIPFRTALTVLSGLLEAALAVAVLIPASAKAAGFALCAFLLLVTPINLSAALRKVDFGGHAAGPRYLWVRLPLQALLLIWAYWFAIRAL